MTDTAHPKYGPRYEEALSYAARLHTTQLRKGDKNSRFEIPYVAHLLEVSALVWLGGGDEDQAIAGLLHDAIEDQSDHTSPEEIERRFGPAVRRIVLACSDGAPDIPRGPETWLRRKAAYLAALYSDDHKDAILVTVADKISNARAITDDLMLAGDSPERREALWGRFNAPRQASAWYYAEVLHAAQRWNSANPLVQRLEPLARAIETAAGGSDVQSALGLSDDDLQADMKILEDAKHDALKRLTQP